MLQPFLLPPDHVVPTSPKVIIVLVTSLVWPQELETMASGGGLAALLDGLSVPKASTKQSR